jgi:hypothetical protein
LNLVTASLSHSSGFFLHSISLEKRNNFFQKLFYFSRQNFNGSSFIVFQK